MKAKTIVGNTIRVAQPSPELIAAELPPTAAQQSQYFNVVYAGAAAEHGSSNLQKKKALTIDRQEYLECAQIQKERCPLFADTPINASAAAERLPATGVPHGTEQGAMEMESIEHFHPTLSGPATTGIPFCAQDDQEEADDVEDAPGGDPNREDSVDTKCCRAPDALVAEENANAEFLIGLDGTPNEDALSKLAAVRAKINVAHEVGSRMQKATVRAKASENDSASALQAGAEEAALRADHKHVFVHIRTMARSMGDRFTQEIEANLTAVYRTIKPATLRVHTGAPLSLFDPAAWVACLTEFFYGDCGPNLERPAKISWRYLFKYLMNREELEYHLETDMANYGKRYVATPDISMEHARVCCTCRGCCEEATAATEHEGVQRTAHRSAKTGNILPTLRTKTSKTSSCTCRRLHCRTCRSPR